jgi:hypothetical protein
MAHADSAVSVSTEEQANSAREMLHYYNISLHHLSFDILAMFDADRIENIEQAKAEVAFAVTKFRLALDSAVFNGALLLRETEVQKFVAIAEKYGVSENDVARIPRLFKSRYSAAERVANVLAEYPEYKG